MPAGLLAGGIAAGDLRPLLRRRHPLHRLSERRASTATDPRARRADLPAAALLGARLLRLRRSPSLVCGIFAEGFMFRGWVYSIIGGDLRPRRLPQHRPRRDPRLLPPAAASRSAARCCRSKRSPPPPAAEARAEREPQSGVMPEVAPSRGPDADDVAHREDADQLGVRRRRPGGGCRGATSRPRRARGSSRARRRSRRSLMWSRDPLGVGVLAGADGDAGGRAR